MNNLFIGNTIINLDSVDSTNNYGTELLKATQVYEGTVINADIQTNGRGQRGNNWISEPGANLTFSIILHPTFLKATEQFSLLQAISIGLLKGLKSLLPEVLWKIKWPNDIYADNKKVAGMLIENSISAGNIGASVVGIGINVNQKQFGELRNATSLSTLFGQDWNRDEVLAEILGYIEPEYIRLKSGFTSDLADKYEGSLLFLNESHRFKAGSEVFEGTITGVSPEGKLKVLLNGQPLLFDLKEIDFLLG